LNRKLEFAKHGVKAIVLLEVSLLVCLFGISLVAAQGIESSFEIKNLKVEPNEAKVGEVVTITADVNNRGNTTSSYEVMLLVNDVKVDSQTVSLAPNETKTVEFIYVPIKEGNYTITIGDKFAEFKAIAVTEPKFRVGPVVKLQPVNDIISFSKDGLIELFFSNPDLNDGIMLSVEAWISVPAGIHVYGEGFASTTAAGTIYGQFEILPGKTRTIYVNIKADETTTGKSYFIHFSGLYYPNNNKDAFQPISLTHPFKVVEASPNPHDSAPTNPDKIPNIEPQAGGIVIGWSGVTLWIILAAIIFGLGLIALTRR